MRPVHVGTDPVVHNGLPDHAAQADGDAASNQILHILGDEQRPRPGGRSTYPSKCLSNGLGSDLDTLFTDPDRGKNRNFLKGKTKLS